MKSKVLHCFIAIILLFSLIPNNIMAKSIGTESDDNLYILNKTGVSDWQKEGFKGKNVEVIVIDKGELSSDYKYIENVKDPFNNVIVNKDVQSHLSSVVETIHLSIPDAKIYVFQDISMIYIYDWIEKNNKDIDLINFSLLRNLTDKEKAIMPLFANKDIVMFTAIGNYSSSKVNPVASSPYWLSVGAVVEQDNMLRKAVYSGISDELDFMSFTDIKLSNGKVFNGTSSSTALLTGMVGIYIDAYKEKEKKKPSRTHIIETMKANVIKNDAYKKEEYGNGIFRLPSIYSVVDKETKLPLLVESNAANETVQQERNNQVVSEEHRGKTIELIQSQINQVQMIKEESSKLRTVYFAKLINK